MNLDQNFIIQRFPFTINRSHLRYAGDHMLSDQHLQQERFFRKILVCGGLKVDFKGSMHEFLINWPVQLIFG